MKHTFKDTITVRQRDIDVFGHVNNSIYLTYAEEARWRLLYAKGILETYTQGFSMVTANIEFLKPITYPNEVIIETYFDTPGQSSFMFHHILSLTTAPEVICTKIDAKVVCFDLKTNKSIPIPENFRSLFST